MYDIEVLRVWYCFSVLLLVFGNKGVKNFYPKGNVLVCCI